MTPNTVVAGSAPAIIAPGPPEAFGKQYTDEEARRLVAALEEPFDPREIKWRVTNTTSDRRRGQMLAYADPRAYTDRLNSLFTVRGWTRDYDVKTINNVERKLSNGTQMGGKVVVKCRVTIYGLGVHSGIGEEWADNENAGTAAEAQAFKRACACFGLGRYLYDLEAAWVDLDEHKRPKSMPKLPAWAIPNRKQTNGAEQHFANQAPDQQRHQNRRAAADKNPANLHSLKARVTSLASEVGYNLSRSVLVGIAKVDSPEQVAADLLPATAAKLEDTLRGVQRLRAAADVVGQQHYTQLCRELNFASDALDDIPDRDALRKLIALLEKEAGKPAIQIGAPAQTDSPGPSTQISGKQLREARSELIKAAQRVARSKRMKVADIVDRAAKGNFTFANLQRLTAETLPAIKAATEVLRRVP